MKYRYWGLCEKFGRANMIAASVFTPAVANVIINYNQPLPVILATSAILSTTFGTLGFGLAMKYHKAANGILRARKTKKENGHKIVRYGQIMVYSVPLIASLAFSMAFHKQASMKERTQSPDARHLSCHPH